MIANLMLSLLPPTRLFGLKRLLLRTLGVVVGDGTRVCGAVQFFGGGKVAIGRDCWIGLNVRFYTSPAANVTIGDNCDIAPETCFMTGTHEMGGPDRRAGPGRSDHVWIGGGTWIGVRSTLLGGAEIGRGSIVGAGSLVLGRETEANSLLMGSPAKVMRQL